MSEKIKVLVLSDHPLAPSGVGTQTNYMIQSLLRTGKYKFLCLGGAMKHENYEPQVLNDPDWDDGDLIVHPVDGYGNPDMIRSILWTEKPDILWFMTDPRFYPWLWQMENEIRRNVPMVYYHVWDNYPPPKYNGKWYESTDVIVSISKVTHDVVSKVSPEVENHYLPHAVNPDIFRVLSQDDITKFKEHNFPDEKFTFYWNNRNARRKQSGTLMLWFNEFAEEVGPDNVRLILHTDPFDQHGQNLEQILVDFNMIDGRIVISKDKLPPENLAVMYNMSDCTVNISDAEGFGLATLESLSCGTPIIVNMTGGLQEQVTDGENWFGIGIEPASKSIIGSQEVPYIYEDRISKEDFIKALHTMYNMPKEDRDKLGQAGRKHVEENYSFERFSKGWIELMDDIHERHGSWDTRKNYTAWSLKEVM
tara:strand:+ start:437 stop:1699 length:1263 start_codon:yes stop_codon:yes gene_type:complete